MYYIIYYIMNNLMSDIEDFMTQIQKHISFNLGREITNSEQLFILNQIKKINYKALLKKYNNNKIINSISKILTKQILSNKNQINKIEYMQNKQVDSKQIHSIKIDSFLGYTDADKLLNDISTESNHKKYYVVFDSKYRYKVDGNLQSEFKWLYNPNKQINEFSVTSNGLIDKIISMKIYQCYLPWYMNNFIDYFNLDAEDIESKYSSIFLSRRISIYIKELDGHASIIGQNTKYHFIGSYVVPPYGRDEIHFHDNNEFKFITPAVNIDSYTFILQDPINKITFLKDTITVEFTLDGNTILITKIDDEVFPNYDRYLFYITGFTTNNPLNDKKYITAINNPHGITMSSYLGESVWNSGISFDDGPPDLIDGLQCQAFIEQHRLIIPIEFTCLE